jgi:hypothetical protein
MCASISAAGGGAVVRQRVYALIPTYSLDV